MPTHLLNQHQAEQAWHVVQTNVQADRIEFATGEYEGPFILDRPLHLIGQDPPPVLWARHGPVIIVRSAGVQIENLCVEATFDPQDVAVLLEAPTTPLMRQLQCRGQVRTMNGAEHAWVLPAVLDLGDLAPHQPVSMWAEVFIPTAVTIKTEPDGPKVTLRPLDHSGHYRLYLAYDPPALRPQTLIRNQIELVGPEATHRIWVLGRVLAGLAPDLVQGELMLTAGTQRFFAKQFFQLGKLQLQGVSGNSALAACQALLARNADGSWAIFQPGRTPHPTKLNGVGLWPGQRRLLPQKATIQVNTLTLNVVPTQGNLLEVPAQLDLGTVTSSQAQAASFILHNRQRTVWAGTVSTTVPWLRARQATLQCPAQGQTTIAIAALPEVAQLPVGAHSIESGLLLTAAEQVWAVDVQLIVAAAPVQALTFAPTTLELGDITSTGPYPTLTIQVQNAGPEAWDGSVWTQVPWVTVSPHQLYVASGGVQTLTLGLNQQIQQLPLGALPDRSVLLITGDHVKQAITLHGTLSAPRPQPVVRVPAVAPLSLGFGIVSRKHIAGALDLTITNNGATTWHGTIVTRVPWLLINQQPSLALTCLPGESKVLTVSLVAQALTRTDTYTARPALVITDQTTGVVEIVATVTLMLF